MYLTPTAPMPPSPQAIAVSALPWKEQTFGSRFHFRRKSLGAPAGGQRLGCSLYEVPPGYRAWPFHYHCANEEAIYILSGRGTLRLASEDIPVTAGDYIALPPGPQGVHQLVNTGTETLQYLCLSTMAEPDVVIYPDSGKVGIFGGAAPGGDREQRTFHKFLALEAEVDYWQGEATVDGDL